MRTTPYADQAGQGEPTSDEARAQPGFREQDTEHASLDFQTVCAFDQAWLRIEGEAFARAWLERLQAGRSEPGELALIVAFLTGEMLHGACRFIEKLLEARYAA